MCDKCGRDVGPRESALILEAISQGIDFSDPWSMTIYLNYGDRHLLPIVENGVAVCPGSPSRAQYLPGQPRDPRYSYSAEMEESYRAAREEQLRRFKLA